MKVSVISATYNRAHLLEELLEQWKKVDECTQYEYELIFSDDGSQDNTVQFLQAYKGLPLVVLENEHGGAAKARNSAVQLAKGELIIFTGDDIFPEPDFINKHYEYYKKNGSKMATLGRIEWRKNLDVTYLMTHITEVGCEQFGFVALPAYSKVDFRHFYTSNISVAKTELAQLDKVFDLTFDKYGFEDIELGYRLYKNNVEIFYAPDVLVYHDHPYHSIKKFCKRQQDAGEELAVFKKLHPELTEAEIKMDLDGFRECCEKDKSRQSCFLGAAVWLVLQMCILAGSVLGKAIKSYPYGFLKKACSKTYQFIFRIYMLAGLARGFGGEQGKNILRELAFAFHYLYFGYAQLFFSQGGNYCEEASRKIVTAGRKKIELVFDLQGKSYVDFRLDPLNFECKVRNLVVQAMPLQGPPILLTEVSGKYNFSHTQDPSIEFTLPATEFAKLMIAYQLEYSHWQRGVRFAKRCLKWLRDKSRAAWRNKNSNNRLSGVLAENLVGSDKVYITVRCEQPELLQRYQSSCAVLAPNVILSAAPYEAVTNYRQYIYEPTTLADALDEMQFLNGCLCLLYQELDFVVVSNSLHEYPVLGAASLADCVIYASKFKSVAELSQGRQDVQGRILRLEGKRHNSQELNLTKEFSDIVWEQSGQLRRGNPPLNHKVFPKAHEAVDKEKKKPLVFVLPVFMAVGGVERNTIEVMREMKEQYEFVVITYEKHTMQVGNLFSQLYGLCKAFYDFHEVMTLEQYLSGLDYLKTIYQPDIVWLPNSNPWSLDQLPEIRKIFIDTPMVAQDVYDTEVGWIAHYDRPCTKAYDRYIAINSKIRDKFIQVYGLAQDKIDLIYSAVNVEKLKRLNDDPTFNREQVLVKYGLAADKEYFAFIGRVTEQKQPLAFVELAKHAMAKYADVRFVMVGSGNLNEAVETKISECGLEGKFHRIQFIENLYEFTKSLHGLIITSKYEGLPIVSIEAMGVGTPILSTDVGDMRLFVEKYNLGVIAATSKTRDLEQAFDVFYSQLDQFKANAEQGINENLHFFSSEFAAEQMDKVFKRSMEPYRKIEKIVSMETKKEPVVSVIIPSYNHEAYIQQAVESVLGQSYSNLELIVIDDGSTDGSVEILANIADVRYTFLAQENQGAHNAINRGLALAKGKYLAILNSDDVFAPERLKKCVQYMENDPETLLVCSYIEIIDTAGNTKGIKEGWRNMEPWPILDKKKSYAASDDFTKNLLLANFISTTSNMVFRRDVFEKIGGMRNLRYAHDWDFALRIAAMGPCKMIEEPLMKYRLHGSNTISKGRKHMLFEICWIYATHLPVFYPLVLAGQHLEAEVELLLNSLNLQGNDKLLWVLFSLQASLKAQGVAVPEVALLDDAKLRERLMAYIVE